MHSLDNRIVLGSRSPRRLELLRLIVPEDRIDVIPPSSSDEPGFGDTTTWDDIEQRLREITQAKSIDVLAQSDPATTAAVISADTVIVAQDEANQPVVLGQPPDDDTWRDVVRNWFERYLLGKTHTAATCVLIATPAGETAMRTVKTEVTFDADTDCHLDWYLDTEESKGKAGGYAIQGAGSVFVSEVRGSLSNVVGLPIRTVRELLAELGLDKR